MNTPTLLLASVVAFAASFTGTASAQTSRACVTMPAGDAPIIDGEIGAQEWAQASVITGLVRTGGGSLATPATTVYLLHDHEALFLAFHCKEPDDSRRLGFARAHDDQVYADDCVSVFVAPEDLDKAGQARIHFGGYEGSYNNWYSNIQTYYEFTVNGLGSMSEARNDVRAWDAPWQAKVSRGAGAWTAEIRIPLTSLGVTELPGDTLWGLNLFRIRQPDASGWVNPGHGGYTPLPLGALRVSSAEPVVRQEALAAPSPGHNALAFSVMNPAGQPAEVELSVNPTGGEPVLQSLSLQPGETRQLSADYQLQGEGGLRANFTLRVKGQEAPLLSGAVPLSLPRSYTLSLRYFTVPGRAEGTVQLGPASSAVSAVLALESQGTEVARCAESLAGRRGERLSLPVPTQPGGQFLARLKLLDGGGRVLSETTRGIAVAALPDWLGTRAGLPLGVLPPWTPIQVKGKAVEMLGKRLTFADSALPSAIASAAGELLAAPMNLRLLSDTGQAVSWDTREFRISERTEDRVKVESLWRREGLELRVSCTLEYDGFCWVEMTLRPRRGASRIGRLSLDIPLRSEVAKYAYQGHAQACGALSPHGLRAPVSYNLWVGDENRGIAWLAESLEWVQARDRANQVEVIRGENQTLWRSTFIDSPTEISAPYTARFALHVTPARPVSLHKSRIYHGAYYGMEDAVSAGSVRIPAEGRFDTAQGTLEMWVRPTFDVAEEYDPDVERSAYNRQFLSLGTSSGQILILYYNADDRSMRLITTDGKGGYPVILSGTQRLKPGAWNYVGLSWGEEIVLGVNGALARAAVKGSVPGSVETSALNIELTSFDLDDLRISRRPLPLDTVPDQPLARDEDTRYLETFDTLPDAASLTGRLFRLVEGRLGQALASAPEPVMDRLALDGKRIVIYHENWSRFQGYPDLEQIPRLKRIADACHQRGMLFLIYFNQSVSDASPEWPLMRDDLLVLPEGLHYHRDDVVQDCYGGCVNGPYGDLLLAGIEKLADETGIDGVYMDGTTVPWHCANPSHPGCGEYRGDGTYLHHQPLRATRQFMKRLRSIFASRGQNIFLDAHTGGCINIATQSFCDGYYDGETLHRFKPGFRLAPDTLLTGYMGKQFGFRGEFLPHRHSMDQALALGLVHDTMTRGQPAEVDLALADYEDDATRFVPYWEDSGLFSVKPEQVLGSVYLKPDRAMLVLGSQTEDSSNCDVDLAPLLENLPPGVEARDAMSGEPLELNAGRLSLSLPGRGWRMVELRPR